MPLTLGWSMAQVCLESQILLSLPRLLVELARVGNVVAMTIADNECARHHMTASVRTTLAHLRIIVREKRDLQSLQLEERLSTGALVEQTELIGDRLHFSKVSGSGPETGWVSIRMASKDLLVVVKPPLRHWRSELVPVLRSSSAQCRERPRVVSLPRLPQPKSAPPPTRTREDRQDHSLPPLPFTQDRSMYWMQPAT